MGIGDRDYMGGGGFAPRVRGYDPVWVIIGINVLVFILWQVADGRFMRLNFLVSRESLEAGRVWTLLTAAFSHESLFHLLVNMLVLFGFAQALRARWGDRRFVRFYLAAAVFSSACQPLTAYLGWAANPALGASGAVCGVVACFAIYYPKATILLWGLIPMPAWFLVAALCAYDLYGLIETRRSGPSGIGHAAHLAGACAAAVFVYFIEPRLGAAGSRRRARRAREPRGRVLRPDESTWGRSDVDHGDAARDPDDQLLDMLLTKVQKGGLDSLSSEERHLLERISEKRRSGRR
ncbi:MAG: rhomboid family intramembrane serine protease [Planctomycetota bacterium]